MRILITGTGRGGTCWLTEIVRASGVYNFTKQMEDREIFHHMNLPDLYGTKLVTENPNFTWENIEKLMTKYTDLYVLFSMRHPVSLTMAQTANTDGKTIEEASRNIPEDISSNIEKRVRYMYNMYTRLKEKYPDRVSYTKLEDRIINREEEVNKICKTLGIEFNGKMLDGHKNTRNRYHQKRYGKTIDKSQADICANWETAYNGFFKNNKDDIDQIKEKVKDIAEYFNYKM